MQHYDTKSEGLAFVLTFLFGPLGMFYSGWPAALATLALHVAALFVFPIIGNAVLWIAAPFYSIGDVRAYNKRQRAQASK